MNSSHICPLSTDDKFGPYVVGCRGDFDFTLLFEQGILSLGPSALVLVASVARILHLYRCRIKTVYDQLRCCKSIAILCAACLRLALLVLWITEPGRQTRVSVAAAALPLIATLTLAVLSNVEHTRSVRPSFIITTYLFFSTLLDLAQARTLWLLPGDRKLAAIFTACIAFNTILLILESIEKKAFLKSPYSNYPPEALSGIFNRSVFWWLNGLFLNGYRRVLNLSDLFEIDDELSSQKLQQRIRSSWQHSKKDRNHSLLLATLSCFKVHLSKIIFPRICASALKFSQPLLINRAISLISQPQNEANRHFGYGLIGATALLYFALAIGNAKYKHKLYRVITMVRGGLISLISDVTLLLDAESARESAAVTLASTDVDRIVAGLEYSDFIWAAPIEMTVAIYLLHREIGLSCLVPLGISLGSAAAGYFVGNAATKAQRNWVDAMQKRVGITASMLSSMKAVKMMGLTEKFSSRVQDLKHHELKQSNKFRRITTMRNAVSNFSFIMAPAFTFAVYSVVHLRSYDSQFNPASAFTSLSIIALLSQSVQWWVIALFAFQASLGCYGRIQKYLLSEIRKDARFPGILLDDVSKSGNEKAANGISFEGMTLNKHRDDLRACGGYAISVEGGSFGFATNKPPIVKNIQLRIKPSTLTTIIGPVGCGKSILLKALLGEIPSANGVVYTSHREIVYCSQEPWLPNLTIKQSVLGVCEFDEQWYNSVIHACALDVDIRQLLGGHDTKIGSNGISLCGGQRQRLALARAIYSRKHILLLDDVLSGLDGMTEEAVFYSVFGPKGLCRNHGTTVVLATYAVKYLRYAEHIVVMDRNGTIEEQGSFDELKYQNDFVVITRGPNVGEYDESLSAKETPPVSPKVATQSGKETKTRLAGDLRIYAYYARAVGWILAFYLCTQATTTFLLKFPDVWLRWWSAAEVLHPGHRTGFFLGIYCMFAGLALCSMVIGILSLFTGVMPRSSARLHRRLLDTVMSAPYYYLAATDSGVILNRFSQDMSLIDMQLPTALLQTADGFMICIAQTVLITTSSKFVATFIPAAIVALYLLQRFYLRTSRQIRLLDLQAKSPMYTHFLETVSGLSTLRAFNWQSAWDERSRELLDGSQRPVYLLYSIQRWLGLVLDFMVAAFAIFIITLATQLTKSASSSGGALGVALVNLLTLSNMLSYLIRAWTDLETSIGAVLRVRKFESLTPSEIVANESQEPPHGDWPQHGSIEFQNIDASYSIPFSCLSGLVLKNITLSIPSGSHVGICGRTGSGKSSLLLTLSHLTEVISGSLIIDDVELRTLNRNTLRKRLVTVPQSPELFPGTLRSNLDPASHFADASIVAALQRVELWAMIQARGGLTAEADQTPLSHGERQLFALACALLRRQAPIHSAKTGGVLVLDEVSASVDAETELRISQIVREEFASWTVMSVAHRLSTIRECDLVVVMDSGRVVEFGKPSDLERAEGGIWRKMVGGLGGGILVKKEEASREVLEDRIEVVRE